MSAYEEENDRIRELLPEHSRVYPRLEAEDIFKFIFQSVFGCEHLVAAENEACGYVKSEYEAIPKNAPKRIESLGDRYSRVHLSCLNNGLTPETLTRLFALSAKKEPNGKERLEYMLSVVKELVSCGDLPLAVSEFDKKLSLWQATGYPPLHHSEVFRAEYRPAYRVISNRYADLLDVFEKIDKLASNDRIIVAIEGGSASGKTTLAEILQEVYDCNVFHMDDFFLRPEQRTKERFSEIGGNIDRERFHDEVLTPLAKHKNVHFRRFDCSTQTLCLPITVEPKKLTVIEGVYSMHPEFSKYYDLAIFLNISPEAQAHRISIRNTPTLAKRFFSEWIPMENKYFSVTNPKARADLIINITQT